MATISQQPGTLDMAYMIQGEAVSFQTIHDGDITGDTFYAAIIWSDTNIVQLLVTSSYSLAAQKTTLNYTLSAVSSAAIPIGQHYWYMTQTSNGVSRTILMGKWICNSRR